MKKYPPGLWSLQQSAKSLCVWHWRRDALLLIHRCANAGKSEQCIGWTAYRGQGRGSVVWCKGIIVDIDTDAVRIYRFVLPCNSVATHVHLLKAWNMCKQHTGRNRHMPVIDAVTTPCVAALLSLSIITTITGAWRAVLHISRPSQGWSVTVFDLWC